jgi:hypothetical protein
LKFRYKGSDELLLVVSPVEKRRSFFREGTIWYRRHIRLALIDYKWIILAFLAIGVFILGIIGFKEASLKSPEFPGKNPSWTDLAILSLRLFTLQTGNLVYNPPQTLDIARFLAIALSFITIALIVITSFYKHFALFWLKHVRKCHAIVCGMGYLGPVITSTLLEMGYTVVVIERDRENSNLDSMKDRGALVIIGDATSEDTLNRAQLHRARCLFAVTGNDAVNISIYLKSDALINKLNRSAPFTCYIHIEDNGLYRLFGYQDLARMCNVGLTTPSRVDPSMICSQPLFFNIYWRAASCLLQSWPFISPDLKDNLALTMEIPDSPGSNQIRLTETDIDLSPPDARILIVGIGTFGESLILQAAFDWWIWFGHTDRKMKISVLDRIATKKIELLKKQHQFLDKYVEFCPLDHEFPSIETIDGKFLFNQNDRPAFGQIYICFANEALALTTAAHFRQILIDKDVSIVFRTVREEQFNALFKQHNQKYPFYQNLSAFPLASCACCVDEIVFHGTNENLAMEIHKSYVRQRRKKGYTRETDPSIASWKDLPHELKNLNRQRASNIKTYLDKTGYIVKPLANWETPLTRFRHSEVELLAKDEHESWRKERETYENAFGLKKDQEKGMHRYYLDWDKLSDDEKETDRSAIRAIPRIYAEIGWMVVKKTPLPDSGNNKGNSLP